MKIHYDNERALIALRELEGLLKPGGLRAALLEIGEDQVESTRRNFRTGTAPDGSRWPPNAQATIEAFLGRRNGSGRLTRKDGRINKAGAAIVANKKPLIDSGLLESSIVYQLLASGTGIEYGTNRFAGEWEGGAAVHQDGSRDGRIPARPFLGISDADEKNILDIIARHLLGPLGD